jgi:hypothetical protein
MSTPGFNGIVGFATALLLIAVATRFPRPSPFQLKTLAIAMALLVATHATEMPGLLTIDIPGAQASGALAVLLLIALIFGLRRKDRD